MRPLKPAAILAQTPILSAPSARKCLKNLAMSVGHYENFPVASILLPARLRQPVGVVYRFARTADDFADEGNLAPTERLARLEEFRGQLRRLEQKQPRKAPV